MESLEQTNKICASGGRKSFQVDFPSGTVKTLRVFIYTSVTRRGERQNFAGGQYLNLKVALEFIPSLIK